MCEDLRTGRPQDADAFAPQHIRCDGRTQDKKQDATDDRPGQIRG